MSFFIPAQTDISYDMRPSTYNPALDSEERKTLIELMQRLLQTDFYNGSCARLESVTEHDNETMVAFSSIEFFDFVAVHVALSYLEEACALATDKERAALDKLLAIKAKYSEAQTAKEVLSIPQLPNSLAVSCLVCDTHGNTILTKRNDTGIGKGLFTTSATGSVESGDLISADPIRACVKRECFEELEFAPSYESIHVHGFAIGDNKMQPTALVGITVDNIGAVEQKLKTTPGFKSENSGYKILNLAEEAEFILQTTRLTEMAYYHLTSHNHMICLE